LSVEENAGKPEIYIDYEYQEKKEGNPVAEIYSLRKLYIMYWISQKQFLSVNTNSGDINLECIHSSCRCCLGEQWCWLIQYELFKKESEKMCQHF
jgi:hypothetical protein